MLGCGSMPSPSSLCRGSRIGAERARRSPARASCHSARVSGGLHHQEERAGQDQSPMIPTDGIGTGGQSPSIPRPTDHAGQWPRPYSWNRSADSGTSGPASSTGSADRGGSAAGPHDASREPARPAYWKYFRARCFAFSLAPSAPMAAFSRSWAETGSISSLAASVSLMKSGSFIMSRKAWRIASTRS